MTPEINSGPAPARLRLLVERLDLHFRITCETYKQQPPSMTCRMPVHGISKNFARTYAESPLQQGSKSDFR